MNTKFGVAVNFSKAFSAMKIVTITAIISVVVTNLYWNYKFESRFEELLKLVFVVSDNNTVAAVMAPTQTPSVYEARNLVRNFMNLMFSHDSQTFNDRIEQGGKLINRSDALAIYQTFSQGKVLEKYTRFNIRTELQIDSIHVNVATEPYTGTVYSVQKVIYPDETQFIPIAARFHLVKTFRSEANPFGLQIRDFNFFEYQPKKED